MVTMITPVEKTDILTKLNKIMDFQINDLKKSMIMAKANFLVAVGCMNTIEFLGGLHTGSLVMNNKSIKKINRQFKGGVVGYRFRSGIKFLDDEYTNIFRDRNKSIELMWELRNSLVHQYLPSVSHEKIKELYIKVDTQDDKAVKLWHSRLYLNVFKLVVDIFSAWIRLLKLIEQDDTMLKNAKIVLSRLPELS